MRDACLDRHVQPHHGFAVQRLDVDRWRVTWWGLGRTLVTEGPTYASAAAKMLLSLL